MKPKKLISLTVKSVYNALTEEELEILGSEHLKFDVNHPVDVFVIRQEVSNDKIFWLHGAVVEISLRKFLKN